MRPPKIVITLTVPSPRRIGCHKSPRRTCRNASVFSHTPSAIPSDIAVMKCVEAVPAPEMLASSRSGRRFTYVDPEPLDGPIPQGGKDFTYALAAVDAEKSMNHEGHPSTSPSASLGASAERAGSGTRRTPSLSNVRRIFSSQWEGGEEEFVYTVRGNGFLHHMVRNLVGTFILVGKRTLQVEDVTRILEARNRSAAGRMPGRC